jgi:nucleotide-binding universal stress UspA family protein
MASKPTDKSGGAAVGPGASESTLPVANALPSLHLRKILVPVDFSDCSRKAVDYAVALARQFQASLELLFVLEITLAAPEMAAMSLELVRNEMLVSAEREIGDLQKALPADVVSTAIVREGNPRVEIIEAAKEFGADLIVISTHGRTGLAHVFLGSTTERIVRKAPCPVLVVREREHEFLEANPAAATE